MLLEQIQIYLPRSELKNNLTFAYHPSRTNKHKFSPLRRINSPIDLFEIKSKFHFDLKRIPLIVFLIVLSL
jgi:hypothetical protein